MKRILFLLLSLLLSLSLFAGGQKDSSKSVIYVISSVSGQVQNGESWNSAFNDLQDAIDIASPHDEIWVAAGTYYPSDSDRSVSFVMKDNVSVYGGFSGSETKLEDRDWKINLTILSGEIGNPTSSSDNSKTVVMAANGILDGFTISDGYGARSGAPSQMGKSNGNPPPSGGEEKGGNSVGHMSPEAILSEGQNPGNGSGIQIWQVAPTIRNCRIINNNSGKGGGVYIVGNGPVRPGEKRSSANDIPVFENCIVGNNSAVGRGGGLSIDLGGSGVFIDCIFSENVCAEGKGGAIYNDFGCSPMFANCLFANNKAESGAAMGNDGESNPKFTNCTFYGNDASAAGAALYQGSGPFNDPSVINSIIWGNICNEDLKSVYDWNDCNTRVSWSILEDGYTGIGIQDIDPLFVDPENMNFDLSADSPALTAGEGDKRIGFDLSPIGTRTESEIEEIIKSFEKILLNEAPVVLDLENPASGNDADNIGEIIYVSNVSNGNGSSWSNALGSLQDAIDFGNAKYTSTGSTVQIWVTEGLYLTGIKRSDSIILREGVELYGGFKGDELDIKERNINLYPVVLSGDIGVKGESSDNSYHVLIGANNSLVDGFTISGGYADKADGGEVYDNKGGGLLNYHGGYRIRPDLTPVLGFDTIVRSCIFEDNYAEEGGAVFTYHGSSPEFDNCDFINNSSYYGGASVDRGGVNSKYTKCNFTGNQASYKGGAVFVDYGSMANINSCTFENNSSGTSGGAVYVIDRASQRIPNETDIHLIDPDWALATDIFSSVLITDSIFNGNSAGVDGGVLYIYESGQGKIVNSVFSGNKAAGKGDIIGLFNKSILYISPDNLLAPTEDNIYKDNSSTINNL